MNADARPAHNPLLAWREVEGAIIIISPEDSVLHELNGTASFIWKQMDGERTIEQIAALVTEEFDVAPEAALADVQELMATLVEKKLAQAAPLARGGHA